MKFICFLLILACCCVEAAEKGFKRPLVTLTFDDGYRSAYEQVFPRLQQHQIEATFYIDTGSLGRDNRIDVPQLIEMSQAGHEIGSHTNSHPHLNLLDKPKIVRELVSSKRELEKILGHPVVHFAPPFGEANRDVMMLIKNHFQSSRSVKPGYNTNTSFNPFYIRVKNIFATTRIKQVMKWLDTAERDKCWLVIVYHQVDDRGDTYSTTPARFERHLEEIKRRKLATATIGKALEEIMPQMKRK